MNGTSRSDVVNDDRVDDDCDGQRALVNWMRLVRWLDDDDDAILSMVTYLRS